jgi:two-component sensor histidine kinase
VHEAALEAIVDALRCERASILLLDRARSMRFTAWRGLSDGYRSAVEGHSPWKPADTDPQPIWVEDIDRTDEPESLKAVVRAENIRGLAFIPLVANGALIGKFMAYYPEAHSFTPEERELAVTIARQLGFGIEQRRAEEQRAFLINELNHRVKNTLATVQSITAQTLRSTERSADARKLLDTRLMALAAAHDLLTRESWIGADLQEVVERGLGPFAGDGSRVELGGPPIRLSPRQALAISMALHELATNAVKYGSLSSTEGRIRVDWGEAGQAGTADFWLKWEESGGPPVTPPARKGFGSRLIERTLEHDLAGAARLEYRPTGVVAWIHSQAGL